MSSHVLFMSFPPGCPAASGPPRCPILSQQDNDNGRIRSVHFRTSRRNSTTLSCGMAEQAPELPPHDAVALAGHILEAGPVEDGDAAVLVADHACLLQDAGCYR